MKEFLILGLVDDFINHLSMRTICIYFSDPKKNGYPFDTRNYRRAYFHLAKKLEERGIQIVFVRGTKTYLGKARFMRGWRFGRTPMDLLEINEPFCADVIFNRGYGFSIFSRERTALVLNHPKLDQICTDKWLTYRILREISPPTILVSSRSELLKNIKKINAEILISKPLDGQDCRDIFVGTKEQVIAKAKTLTYPRIIQQYLDFSGGIPGICRGRHDLRLLILNGKIVCADVRIIMDAKQKIADLSTDKIKRRSVEIAKIPRSIKRLATFVDDKLECYVPRLYAIDVGFDAYSKKPFLIELNARVGLPQPESSWYKKMLAAFVKFLVLARKLNK